MSSIEFRRSAPHDFFATVQPQTDNFVAELSIDDRWDGFLSVLCPLQCGFNVNLL